jgi:2Fe-2S ferredoxin
MAKITYVQPDGSKQTIEGETDATVMEVAVKNQVAGIDADCGGACACATCHVYVAEDWVSVTGAPSEMEEDMLDFAYDIRETSRLSCQLKISDELDGLIVHIPDQQG